MDKARALPTGTGYLEATAVVNPEAIGARAELGYHPVEDLALFGFGEVTAPWGGPVTGVAGVGARWRW